MNNIFRRQYKIFLIILSLLIISFFSYYIKNFKLDASSDTLILQNDQSFEYFNYYNKIFPSKNFLVLAIKADNKIDIQYINEINNIKKKLESIEGVESVFSINDVPILFLNNTKLSDLDPDSIETINNSEYELEKILDEFSTNPLYVNQIINSEKTITSVIINLIKDEEFYNLKELKNNSQGNYDELSLIKNNYREAKENYNLKRNKLIQNIRQTLKKEDINYQYFLGGIDMIADDTLNYIKNDIIVFSVSVIIFIFVVLFLIFKRFKWVIIPILSSLYAIVIMIGLIGFLNWEITAISSNFISLMLILSISMCIHIINNYKNNNSINNYNERLIKSIKIMFWPCFYTTLTTIVAFGSLLFSDIKPVIDFGKIMIISLFIIFLTSFTILPLLISIFPNIDNKVRKEFFILSKFYNLSINHQLKVYSINIIFFIISIFGIYKLNVENSFINYFKKNTEIYQGMKIIDTELGGTTPLDIIIKFEESDEIIKQDQNLLSNEENDFDLDIEGDMNLDEGLFENELNNKDNLANWLSDEKLSSIKLIHEYLDNKSEIGKVQSIYSLINIAEKINKSPLSTFELSILYKEIPENYKEQLIFPYLSIDQNMIKISARIKDSKKIKRQNLIKDIEKHLKENYTNLESAKVNGLLVLYNNMLQSLFSSQIKSLGFVILSIFLMFIILFKSIKLSIIGIVPNILASSFILGFIGIFNIPLDIMTITIAAITIGIAVDNTIHYLYKTKKNINNKMTINESLKNSHKTVGQAVLTTSLTIAFGFSVLSLSNFIPTILFGIFTALAMIIAMLGVLITLPASLSRSNT